MAKGGSRYGAGRPAWKRKAEQSTALDVRLIARKGLLKVGSSFSWNWTTNYGDKAGSVNIKVQDYPERMIVSYQWTPYGDEPREVQNTFTIDRTTCHFGNTRPWLICPQCGTRCAVVYFGARGGRYACRQCVGITYHSQCEDLMGRAWRKQHKLEKHLIDGWSKPKGMHWKTCDRLREGINECEQQKDIALIISARRWGFEF